MGIGYNYKKKKIKAFLHEGSIIYPIVHKAEFARFNWPENCNAYEVRKKDWHRTDKNKPKKIGTKVIQYEENYSVIALNVFVYLNVVVYKKRKNIKDTSVTHGLFFR